MIAEYNKLVSELEPAQVNGITVNDTKNVDTPRSSKGHLCEV